MIIPSGGMDRPDPRDWNYGAIAGSDKDVDIPLMYDISVGPNGELEVQNQGIERNPSTYMSCGSQGIGHSGNSMNLRDDGGVPKIINELLRYDFCDYFKEYYASKGVDPYTEGSRKQDQMRFGRHKGYISGWVKVNEVDEIKANLARNRAIYTGSSRIDRNATKKNNIAVINKGSAHIFCIVGYDDNTRLFKCANSYGPKAYDNGYFYLRYEDIGALFTMHALIDVDDEPLIEAWIRMRDEILDKATKKINEGKKLTVKEKIALRQWGFGHLIPKSDA